MYLRKVIVENIRAFQRLEFDFDRPGVPESAPLADQYRGWNVITGDNAAGKSTLLKAIALALVGPEIARALQPSFAGWIRKGSDTGMIAVQIAFGEEDRFQGGKQRPREPFFAELELVQQGKDVTTRPGKTYMKLKAAARGPWDQAADAWFSLAYGPFRRLFGSSPEAARLMAISGTPPRFATLFREDATLAEATAWLQDLQFKALEQRTESQRLLESVLLLLNDDFLRHGLRVERVDSEGLWLKNERGLLLSLSEMSDGYRSALALLIDMLRHMVTIYGPGNLVIMRDNRPVVNHGGVVLIDEVDAHLHPEWQRLIGDWLKLRFPNVQFITTSHSPFVVQAADPGGLYRLPIMGADEDAVRISEEERSRIEFSTPDEILRAAPFRMEHTRSPVAVEARREFSRLRARAAAKKLDQHEQHRFEQLKLKFDVEN